MAKPGGPPRGWALGGQPPDRSAGYRGQTREQGAPLNCHVPPEKDLLRVDAAERGTELCADLSDGQARPVDLDGPVDVHAHTLAGLKHRSQGSERPRRLESTVQMEHGG